MNEDHHRRLVKIMYDVHDFPALDEYGSFIFGHPILGSWRMFRFIIRYATADIWMWRSESEAASYPKDVEVPAFEEFATLLLHEATHGWCHFFKQDQSSRSYLAGIDEEQVCWYVSRLVCRRLDVSYREDSAELSYKFHLLREVGDVEGMDELNERFPAHNRWPTSSS